MMTRRTKIIGFGSLAFALVALAGLVVCLWMLSHMDAQFETRQNEVAARQAREHALASLERKVEETTAERAALQELVLADDAIADLLSLIETLGEEQGVLLQTQSVDVTAGTTKEFETLRVTVLVTGTYDGVHHMLELLEHLPYQSTLTGITMTKSARGEMVGAWDGIFTIAVTKKAGL